MKYFAFNFDKRFKCKNKDCCHTCCALWDISIDKKTADKYRKDDFFAQGVNEEFSCYRKGENGRCAFLSCDNLCEIIKKYGEKYISKTCRIHPRFINFFSDRKETGLGICCEEAVRLLLCQKNLRFVKVKETKNTKKNNAFERRILSYRRDLIKKIKTSDKPFYALLDEITFDTGYKTECKKDVSEILSSLEILDKEWLRYIGIIPKNNDLTIVFKKFERQFKNLLIYFILRHVSGAFDFTDIYVRTAFSVFSVNAIALIFSGFNDKSEQVLAEVARAYSAETEYSENNLFALYERAESRLDFARIKNL